MSRRVAHVSPGRGMGTINPRALRCSLVTDSWLIVVVPCWHAIWPGTFLRARSSALHHRELLPTGVVRVNDWSVLKLKGERQWSKGSVVPMSRTRETWGTRQSVLLVAMKGAEDNRVWIRSCSCHHVRHILILEFLIVCEWAGIFD